MFFVGAFFSVSQEPQLIIHSTSMRTTTKYLSTKELQRFVHTKEIASEMYRIETISPSGEKEIVASWLAGEGLAAYIMQLLNEALHTKDIQISK